MQRSCMRNLSRYQRGSVEMGRLIAPAHPFLARPRASPVCHASNDAGDFLANVARVAKKIQGSLPIIGLISRITSDEGGFDELAYPEYSRSVINSTSVQFKTTLGDLEKRHGKLAVSKYVLLVLWMVKTGSSLVPAKDIINSMRRMRITQDIEIEIDRFAGNREKAIKKFAMMTIPEGKPRDKAILAVDALSVLCLGIKDGDLLDVEDSNLVGNIVKGAFPEVTDADVEAAITGRLGRAAAYSSSTTPTAPTVY